MRRIEFMDTYVSTYTFEETINEMKKIIQTKTITQHVVLNANKIILMEKDPNLTAIVNGCPLINADGMSIVWANRLLNPKTSVHRVTGIDLFEEMVRVASKEGYRVYYLGACEEVVKKVIDIHQKQYPNLQIAGYSNGYFNQEDCSKIIEDIRLSQSDMLFAAFPSPSKELWLDKHKYAMNVPLLIGVGGSFDVLSGKIKRAPTWLQKMGLEWFYRWLAEPRRLFKRYFLGNIQFLLYVIKSIVRRGT